MKDNRIHFKLFSFKEFSSRVIAYEMNKDIFTIGFVLNGTGVLCKGNVDTHTTWCKY